MADLEAHEGLVVVVEGEAACEEAVEYHSEGPYIHL